MLPRPMGSSCHLLGAQYHNRGGCFRLSQTIYCNERRRYAMFRESSGWVDFLTVVAIRGCSRAGEEASAIINKLRNSMKSTIDFQSDMPDWKKFLEVLCVQNAFGTPRTCVYKATRSLEMPRVFRLRGRWVHERRRSRYWDNDLLCMRNGLSFGRFRRRDNVIICHTRDGQAGCLDRCAPYHRDSTKGRGLWCIGGRDTRYVSHDEVRHSRTVA
jgi:hypothetical protein